MDDAQWRRVRTLFDTIQDLPERERVPFLDGELDGEPEVRAELERLLNAGTAADGFLDAGESDVVHGAIGPYRLLEILGEGGFGVVYLAEQQEPIRRLVALKLIKPGMDSRQILARFQAERQTLARMAHPGIAQVFDAGTTDLGRPFFVMEHVPGDPITAFCDHERMTVRARVELFTAVCDAVQHAHQKGVIHRDLKPSNVLVTHRDGVPVPKVIDFGVAKALGDPLDDGTVMTCDGVIVGTLDTMSPEQAGGGGTVDTRSDVYSLGVVLYRLLTGRLPHDPDRLHGSSLLEAVRMIREEDPPAPSARLTGDADVAELAERRSADPRRLAHELKGELDWITLKALEKDPDRRYASAGEMAADLRRHLGDEPVLAAAPDTLYRVLKFTRRHRMGVTIAALVFLAVVAVGITATIGFGRAVRAEQAARREAESSRQVADFLVELFRASSPDRSRGETVTARSLLADGTRRIEAGLRNDPLVRARLLTAMGDSHINLGLSDEGLRILREALAAAEEAQPPDRRAVAAQLRSLAVGYSIAGQPDSVLALLDRAVALLPDPTGEDAPALAACLYTRASWFNLRGQLDVADSLATEAIGLIESRPPPQASQLLRLFWIKGNIAHRQYRLEDAEGLYLRALALAEESGEPSWSASTHRYLASLYAALGRSDQASAHAEDAVRLARRIYAPGHPNLVSVLSSQAAALAAGGDLAGAIAVREEVIATYRESEALGDLAQELNSAGILYAGTERMDLAVARTEESLAIRRQLFGDDNPRTAETLGNLARWLAEAGQTQRADSCYRAALEVFDRLGEKSIFPPWTRMNYANLCRDEGRPAEAERLYLQAQAALDSTSAGTRPYFGQCLVEQAFLWSLQGRHEDAEERMRIGFRLRGEPSAEDRDLGQLFVLWASARARAGDPDGAADKLALAAQCGVQEIDTERHPELAALSASERYSRASSP